MDLDGTNKVRITQLLNSGEMALLQKSRMNISNFEFSSDGRKMILIREEEKGNSVIDYYNILKFYTMNIDGSELKEIYSIDGSNLEKVYRADALGKSGASLREYEYLPDGRRVAKIYDLDKRKSFSGTIWQLKYSPDNKSIVFIADYVYKKGIYSLNLKDGIVTELTEGKEKWHGLNNFTFTPDGKKILFIADIYPFGNPKIYGYIVYFHMFKSSIKHLLFRKESPFYDNKYICIMDIDGRNLRKIAKLPAGTEIGLNSDFVHWE
jgi:Tol biopolymer transport system component